MDKVKKKPIKRNFFTRLFKLSGNIKKEEPENLKGQGNEKFNIPSNIFDIYNRLEVLLGLKLRGHTDTITEASNLIDDLYKIGEIQNKRQYQMLFANFQPHKWNFQVNY